MYSNLLVRGTKTVLYLFLLLFIPFSLWVCEIWCSSDLRLGPGGGMHLSLSVPDSEFCLRIRHSHTYFMKIGLNKNLRYRVLQSKD